VDLDEMSARYEVALPPGRIDRITVIHPPRKNADLIGAISDLGDELGARFDSALKDFAATITSTRPATTTTGLLPATRQLSPSPPLDAYLLNENDPDAFRTLRDCVRVVYEREYALCLAGFAVPMRSGRVEWRWARGPAGARAGITTFRSDGRIRTIVAVNITPTDLRRTIFHEIGHVIDFHVHGGAEFSKDELEARADAFERRMLA
jgi:hypothetical protein